MAFAEIDRFCRHHDPHPIGRKYHDETASPRATATIREIGAPDSRRTVTEPMHISTQLVSEPGCSAKGSLITNPANSIPSSGAGKTS
jgi:hypothetical protein